MEWQTIERIESAAIAILAVAGFAALDGSWTVFLATILLPDIFMVGYLRDSRTGALVYNLGHAYIGPVLLAGAGLVTGSLLAQQATLIWIAHIAGDRSLGYGLKKSTGFGDTHLDMK